jgi:hypothetical protein
LRLSSLADMKYSGVWVFVKVQKIAGVVQW